MLTRKINKVEALFELLANTYPPYAWLPLQLDHDSGSKRLKAARALAIKEKTP
jgi:hypothetical protein